jgi:hypothetical protein
MQLDKLLITVQLAWIMRGFKLTQRCAKAGHADSGMTCWQHKPAPNYVPYLKTHARSAETLGHQANVKIMVSNCRQ